MQLWLLASFAWTRWPSPGRPSSARAVGAGDASRARGVAERLLALGVASGGVLAAGLLLLGEPVLWPLLASAGRRRRRRGRRGRRRRWRPRRRRRRRARAARDGRPAA